MKTPGTKQIHVSKLIARRVRDYVFSFLVFDVPIQDKRNF